MVNIWSLMIGLQRAHKMFESFLCLGVVSLTNSIVCPRAPRQCLAQLILPMATVQARNLSSETFQLQAAFFYKGNWY